MACSSSPDSLNSSKVVRLVALHHGHPITDETGASKCTRSTKRLSWLWKQEAKRNRLTASRQRIALEDLPEDRFPVILELRGGREAVIATEKVETRVGEAPAFIIQFPDARESLVRLARLKECYDGVCVFLQPEAAMPRVEERGLARLLSRLFVG